MFQRDKLESWDPDSLSSDTKNFGRSQHISITVTSHQVLNGHHLYSHNPICSVKNTLIGLKLVIFFAALVFPGSDFPN